MPPTRPQHPRRTLHLLLPSPSSTSTSLTPSSPSAPSSQPLRPTKRVLALARQMAASRGQLLLEPMGPFGKDLDTAHGKGGGGDVKRPGGHVGELSEGKSMKGCREWNGLLCWARKGRGARWDASTQMYHVDYLSPEYYEPALVVPVPIEEEDVKDKKVKKEAAPSVAPAPVSVPETTATSTPESGRATSGRRAPRWRGE